MRGTPCPVDGPFYQSLFDRCVSHSVVYSCPFVSLQILTNNSKHTLNLISNILLPLITIDNDTRDFFVSEHTFFRCLLSQLCHNVHILCVLLFGFIDTFHCRVCMCLFVWFTLVWVLFGFFAKRNTTLSIVVIMCKLQFSFCD